MISLECHTKPDGLLKTQKDVCRLLKISKSTLYRMVESGNFPQPKRLFPRITRWAESEVIDWLDSFVKIDSIKAKVRRATDMCGGPDHLSQLSGIPLSSLQEFPQKPLKNDEHEALDSFLSLAMSKGQTTIFDHDKPNTFQNAHCKPVES